MPSKPRKLKFLLESEIHAILTKLLKELKPADFRKMLIIVDANKYRLRKE